MPPKGLVLGILLFNIFFFWKTYATYRMACAKCTTKQLPYELPLNDLEIVLGNYRKILPGFLYQES